MLSNLSMLKCKVNDNDYQFLCSCNAPLNEVKEALFQFTKFVGQIEDNARIEEENKKLENKEEGSLPIPDVENYCCASQIEEPING